MPAPNGKYVVDEAGKRVGVVLDIQEYERLLAAWEELESVRAYDAAQAAKDEAVPFEKAVEEIKRERK